MVPYTYDFPSRWGSLGLLTQDTPDFSEKKANGELLPYNNHIVEQVAGFSPLAMTYNGLKSQRDAAPPQEFLDVLRNGTIHNYAGDYKSVTTLLDMENEVSMRLLSKVRNTDLNLGITIGEFPQTARFIASAMGRAVRGYRQLRRGQVRKALNTLGFDGRTGKKAGDSLSNRWLEYSFAVRPLVSDVYNAAKVLEHGLLKGPKPFIFSSKIQKNHRVTVRNGTSFSASIEGLAQCSGRIVVEIEDPTLYSMEQLGLTNPATVAWELVPFSFVVDWFVPVNEFIQNIFPPAGVKAIQGYTYTKAWGSSNTRTSIPPPEGQEYGWYTSANTYERLKDRKVFTGFPNVRLVIPDLSLSKSQVASGMALLWQQLRR